MLRIYLRDMLRGRFYKLRHHKKHYPRLLSSSYFTCLIIWKEVCYYSKRLFNLYPQYLESHEIGAIPDMEEIILFQDWIQPLYL